MVQIEKGLTPCLRSLPECGTAKGKGGSGSTSLLMQGDVALAEALKGGEMGLRQFS